MTTLLAFVSTLPELTGRVYLEIAPNPPATPYAIVEDVEGGIDTPLYGGADIVAVYPSVTVYHKPAQGQTPQTASLALKAIMTKLLAATGSVDTHSDGVTAYQLPLRRASDFTVRPDSSVAGQFYATLRLKARMNRA